MGERTVVLVDPLYEGNIGHIARSMLNFDVDDLRVVAGAEITNAGRNRAVHAQDVLDGMRRCATLDEALSDCDLAVGFTARLTGQEGKFRRNPLDLREWAPRAAVHPGRVALVFGREDRGLTNEEADRCDVLVSIPTSDRYRSMNLAHAVTVALFALYAQSGVAPVKEYTPATREQLDLLAVRFETLLAASDYPEHKRPGTATMFRRLIGRGDPTAWEITTFLGVMRDVLYHLGVRRDRPQAELPPALRTDLKAFALDVAATLAHAQQGEE